MLQNMKIAEAKKKKKAELADNTIAQGVTDVGVESTFFFLCKIYHSGVTNVGVESTFFFLCKI